MKEKEAQRVRLQTMGFTSVPSDVSRTKLYIPQVPKFNWTAPVNVVSECNK